MTSSISQTQGACKAAQAPLAAPSAACLVRLHAWLQPVLQGVGKGPRRPQLCLLPEGLLRPSGLVEGLVSSEGILQAPASACLYAKNDGQDAAQQGDQAASLWSDTAAV